VKPAPLGLCVLWLKTVFEVVQSTGFDAGVVRWRFESSFSKIGLCVVRKT